ncbi:F-box domain-containing protein, partial [Meloidogyne graminicola]
NKWILALKEIYNITIYESKDDSLKFVKLIEPISNVVHYPLNEGLLKKWQSAIDAQIPLYLFNFNSKYSKDSIFYLLFIDEDNYLKLILPNYPKNIEEMKIICFWLEQLFCSSFKIAWFYNVIFNPEIIKLIFENHKVNSPRFYFQKLSRPIYLCELIYKNQFNFINNNLITTNDISLRFDYIDNNDEQINYLFKLLINSGKRIPFVYISKINDPLKLYYLIVNHIKTSSLCSEIVPNYY